jgi:D-3-phosphoglycerate dehydrogenase/C-terminal binding protein
MPARAKVVVADFIVEGLDPERRVLGGVAEPVALGAHHEDDLHGHVEDADALMMYHTIRLTERTIGRLHNCKLIVRCGVGYDNVDGAAARRCGIPVANVPDYGTEEVADSAVGLMLALTRGIYMLAGRMRDRRGPWHYAQGKPLYRLRGRTFGVVGLGRIGTAAALRAKALGMDVLFFDPYVPDGRDKALGVRRAETLSELLAHSHVISLHCPLTPETHHLINRETLAQMPAGSFLVNTARGGVADALAVLDALAGGHLAGAALDVLEHEPPSDDHPLLAAWRDPGHPAHDRLILTPHVAFYSEEGLLDMRIKGSENCRRVLLGQPPRNVVN